jgi:hypothetical protein
MTTGCLTSLAAKTMAFIRQPHHLEPAQRPAHADGLVERMASGDNPASAAKPNEADDVAVELS